MWRGNGIPFSISILAIVMCIVGVLSASLFALGWRATSLLEGTVVDLRMSKLDKAVEAWLNGTFQGTVFVQQVLAQTPALTSAIDSDDDGELVRQLSVLLQHHAAIAAAYVGSAKGRYVYVGRARLLSARQRADMGMPGDAVLLIRSMSSGDGARNESWYFVRPDGGHSVASERASTFDPTARPWYREAMAAGRPIMTEPYKIGLDDVSRVSVATPAGAVGVLAFDFTLEKLSELAALHRPTPSSVVMVATAAGSLLANSSDCVTCPRDEKAIGDVVQKLATEVARRGIEEDRTLEVGGEAWNIMVDFMPEILGQRLLVAAALPLAEVAGESRKLMTRAAAIALAAIVIAMACVLLTSLVLSTALKRLATRTERIRELDFGHHQPVRSWIREVVQLSDSIDRMHGGLEIFGRYVAKDLVRRIMRSPDAAGVGGERREVTVMFSDIEGFSRLSEDIPPELLTSRLSRYFDTLAAPIGAHRGTIDKFIGDSIMAFWNAPEIDADHVEHACRAALQAAAAGSRLAEKWSKLGRPSFRTRFGLHTGPAVIGNVGARDRVNYTLVGTVANQASRLEGLNKFYKTEILASGVVVERTRELFRWRHLDSVVPAGTSEVLEVYELLAEARNGPSDMFLDLWADARRKYVAGDFASALEAFETAAREKPNDGPCRVFAERCHRMLQNPPDAPWCGIWHFDAK